MLTAGLCVCLCTCDFLYSSIGKPVIWFSLVTFIENKRIKTRFVGSIFLIFVGDQFTATSISDKHRTFSHVNEVIQAIQEEEIHDFYILIKGSNSMKLAQTVPYL